MVGLFPLFDHNTVLELHNRQTKGRVGHFLAVHQNAALLYQLAGFTVGTAQLGTNHGSQQANLTVLDQCGIQLGGRHVLVVGYAAEQLAGCTLGLFSFLGTVHHAGQLVSQDFLGLVQLLAFPVVHLIDLLQRQEGQHADALEYISIADIAPVLVELERAGLVGVKPDGVALGLAELLALSVGDDRTGEHIHIHATYLVDQVKAGREVAPLVGSTKLQHAMVFVEQVQEVVALQHLVAELGEGNAIFGIQSTGNGVFGEHGAQTEVLADVTQEVDDIISSSIVKDSIINNADCKILLDQRKYMTKFDGIQSLLGLSDKEKAQILSINLSNDPSRLYKEVWIGLGGVQSAVYATEVSAEEYLTYTTEEVEKVEVFNLAKKMNGDIEGAIRILADKRRNSE